MPGSQCPGSAPPRPVLPSPRPRRLRERTATHCGTDSAQSLGRQRLRRQSQGGSSHCERRRPLRPVTYLSGQSMAARLLAPKLLFQKLLQRNRLVVRSVLSAKDQRDPAPSRSLSEGPPRLLVAAQLLKVALAKLIPFRRIVAEPLAQRVARRDVFHPSLDFESLFLNAARPQAIDQVTRAVAGRRWIVRSLDLDAHCWKSSIVELRNELFAGRLNWNPCLE